MAVKIIEVDTKKVKKDLKPNKLTMEEIHIINMEALLQKVENLKLDIENEYVFFPSEKETFKKIVKTINEIDEIIENK